jgi:hypothetical protein
MSGPGVSGNSSQFVMSSTIRPAPGSQIVIPGKEHQILKQRGKGGWGSFKFSVFSFQYQRAGSKNLRKSALSADDCELRAHHKS